MSDSTLDFQNRALHQQGYSHYSVEELNNLRWGLRFTPTVCMIGAVIALVYHLPYLHFGLAILGIAPMWFPNAHPLDLFYNSVVRGIVGGVKLPANPLPRRIACLMGGLMNVAAGLAFVNGSVTLAYVFGTILIALQLIVNTTHFCMASWMWEAALKLMGKWQPMATAEQIASALAGGATIVDVRDPVEFDEDHCPNAINIPLALFESDIASYKDANYVLYCRSGMRSKRAVELLKASGNTSALNIGSLDDALSKLPTP